MLLRIILFKTNKKGIRDGMPFFVRVSFFLFHIFCEVRQLHVTLASQGVVHGEGSGQVVTGLTHLRDLQVVSQQLLVVGMSTVLDNQLGTLCGRLAAQVGNTLFGDDDVDIVLR